MATIERFIQDVQDLLAPVESGGLVRGRASLPAAVDTTHAKLASARALAADPVWFGSHAATEVARWDWLEAAPAQHPGLEVTEHEVPAGWFARTFGVTPALAA